MPPKASAKTRFDESKMEIIAIADTLIEKTDELDTLNAQALAADYVDDEPRKIAMRALDDLHRGLYGTLTDRQHAQLTFVLTKISEQEKLDHANDRMKEKERPIMDEIKNKIRRLRAEAEKL